MATLSPPTMTTTTHTPFLPKSPQLSSFKKGTQTLRSACTKVSCNAGNKNDNDDQFQFIQNPKNNTPLSFDRRNVLFGLGGMYGAAMTLGGEATNTLAAPIAPDIDKCTLTSAEFDKSVGDRCCPPAVGLRVVKDFKFNDTVMRTRRPAHLAMKDEKWLADYKRGIALMKSLPLSDPRNFMQQARVHCAYCDGAYPVLCHSDQRYEVHASWLFAPFHRWYLYFFEKILGKLVDNPEFALPYWNWDHPDGMRIPEMFKDKDSPLYDPNRHRLHQNTVVDLSYTGDTNEQDYPEEKQIEQNLLLMRKQMLYPTKASVFFGDAYRSGDKADASKGAGALELAPHNPIHSWTGSDTVWANQDMGSFWSAGRDPIFYCHHANVDRMWSVWRNELPGRSRLDIDDPDYLNAYFILYDEDANPIKVYVKDCLDTENLGYTYEEQELPWLFKTVPKPSPRPPKPQSPTPGPTVNFPKTLDSVLKTTVKRPKKSRTRAEIEAAEEVLVINMDIAMSPQTIKYDVFINEVSDPKPGDKTDVKPQFAGSYSTLGHRGGGGDGMAGMTRKIDYRVALSSLLEDIGAADDEFIQVTLVPKVGTKNVTINDIKIELVTE